MYAVGTTKLAEPTQATAVALSGGHFELPFDVSKGNIEDKLKAKMLVGVSCRTCRCNLHIGLVTDCMHVPYA